MLPTFAADTARLAYTSGYTSGYARGYAAGQRDSGVPDIEGS